MHPDIRAQRFDDARKRLQVVAEKLADATGDSSIQEKALAIENPISGVVEPQTRDLLQLEATVECLEAAVDKKVGGSQHDEKSLDDVDGIGPDLAKDLHEKGYKSPEDLQKASDEELLAVDGIGKSKLERIRKDLGGE